MTILLLIIYDRAISRNIREFERKLAFGDVSFSGVFHQHREIEGIKPCTIIYCQVITLPTGASMIGGAGHISSQILRNNS
jgi:hypothetical protein